MKGDLPQTSGSIFILYSWLDGTHNMLLRWRPWNFFQMSGHVRQADRPKALSCLWNCSAISPMFISRSCSVTLSNTWYSIEVGWVNLKRQIMILSWAFVHDHTMPPPPNCDPIFKCWRWDWDPLSRYVEEYAWNDRWFFEGTKHQA